MASLTAMLLTQKSSIIFDCTEKIQRTTMLDSLSSSSYEYKVTKLAVESSNKTSNSARIVHTSREEAISVACMEVEI